MARPSHLPLAVAIIVALAVALSACGGEDAELLPGETAREIVANLDSVQQLAAEGDCVGAESAAQQVGEQIEALEEVDPKLKQALERGAVRLEEVISGCEEQDEALAPATIPDEEEDEGEREPKEKKEKEKKPQDEAETEAPESAPLPPQSNGNGKGLEKGGGPPPDEEESSEAPSGGVSPSAPAGEGP